MSTYSPELRHDLCSRRGSSIKVHREWHTSDLSISFQRTVRVSDNNSTNDLPPDLGSFPLFETSDYQETLPSQIAAKGGYLLPMHRKCCPHLCADYVLTFSKSVRQCGLNSTPMPSLPSRYTSAV